MFDPTHARRCLSVSDANWVLFLFFLGVGPPGGGGHGGHETSHVHLYHPPGRRLIDAGISAATFKGWNACATSPIIGRVKNLDSADCLAKCVALHKLDMRVKINAASVIQRQWRKSVLRSTSTGIMMAQRLGKRKDNNKGSGMVQMGSNPPSPWPIAGAKREGGGGVRRAALHKAIKLGPPLSLRKDTPSKGKRGNGATPAFREKSLVVVKGKAEFLNCALVLLGPGAVTDASIKLLRERFKQLKITVRSHGAISQDEVVGRRLIDQHFYRCVGFGCSVRFLCRSVRFLCRRSVPRCCMFNYSKC